MDTPKSDIRWETGTEWHYFSANRSDSLRPCCVQRDKYKKAEKGQDENGYSKIWIKAYMEVSCFSRSFCKNLVQGANNVCSITVPRLRVKLIHGKVSVCRLWSIFWSNHSHLGLFQSLYTYLFEHNKVVKSRSDLPKNNFIQFQSLSGYLILEYPF